VCFSGPSSLGTKEVSMVRPGGRGSRFLQHYTSAYARRVFLSLPTVWLYQKGRDTRKWPEVCSICGPLRC